MFFLHRATRLCIRTLLDEVLSTHATKKLPFFIHLFLPYVAVDNLAEEMGMEEDGAPGKSLQGAVSSCWGAIPVELLA